MRDTAARRLPTALRLALLSFAVAAAWLTLSFVATSTSAFAQSTSDTSDAHDSPSTISSILSSITEPVAELVTPTVDVVEQAVVTPVRSTVEHVKSTPVGSLVDDVAELASTVADALPTTLTNILADVVDVVDVVDGAADLVEEVTANGPPVTVNTHAAALGDAALAVPFSDASTSHIAHVGESLSSLPEPWVPSALTLISSGAVTAASGSGGAAPASDLPLARYDATIDEVSGTSASSADVPGSPTYDTDSTPD